jgi:hypothetical protein
MKSGKNWRDVEEENIPYGSVCALGQSCLRGSQGCLLLMQELVISDKTIEELENRVRKKEKGKREDKKGRQKWRKKERN